MNMLLIFYAAVVCCMQYLQSAHAAHNFSVQNALIYEVLAQNFFDGEIENVGGEARLLQTVESLLAAFRQSEAYSNVFSAWQRRAAAYKRQISPPPNAEFAHEIYETSPETEIAKSFDYYALFTAAEWFGTDATRSLKGSDAILAPFLADILCHFSEMRTIGAKNQRSCGAIFLTALAHAADAAFLSHAFRKGDCCKVATIADALCGIEAAAAALHDPRGSIVEDFVVWKDVATSASMTLHTQLRIGGICAMFLCADDMTTNLNIYRRLWLLTYQQNPRFPFIYWETAAECFVRNVATFDVFFRHYLPLLFENEVTGCFQSVVAAFNEFFTPIAADLIVAMAQCGNVPLNDLRPLFQLVTSKPYSLHENSLLHGKLQQYETLKESDFFVKCAFKQCENIGKAAQDLSQRTTLSYAWDNEPALAFEDVEGSREIADILRQRIQQLSHFKWHPAPTRLCAPMHYRTFCNENDETT